MRVLIIDDDENRQLLFARQYKGHEVVPALTAGDAEIHLSGGHWDVVQFDHDLGPTDFRTGYDVATWYELRVLDGAPHASIGRAVIHSMNPGGALRIYAALKNAGVPAKIRPFDG